jgi:hypothetical protein
VLLVDEFNSVSGKEGTQNEFLPHLQRAARRAEANRHQQRTALPMKFPLWKSAALEIRVGIDRRHPGSDVETKAAILKRKAEEEGVPLPNDVAMFMASRIKTNVRELEGSLIRLIAYSSLTTRPLTMELAQDVLRNVIDHDEKAVTIEQIQKFVATTTTSNCTSSSRATTRNQSRCRARWRCICASADARLASRNRSQFWRQASFDGDPLDQKVEEMRKKKTAIRQAVATDRSIK